jgi:hypothetical protein
MRLELTTEEDVILRELLEAYLPELRREVARTDAHKLRHLLAQREDLAERILAKLRT